jgi:pimeloyl-ACP methyl ester carboxylesterase
MKIQSPSGPFAAGEHYAVFKDVKIYCRVVGQGPYLVAVSPQWGASSAYLQDAGGLAPLEQVHTMIFVDARGSGHSGRPTDPTRMSTLDMVNDLERLRGYWGLNTLSVLGHSGGGAIALGYGERYASHAGKLILIDSEVTDLYPSPTSQTFLNRWRNDPSHADAVAHFSDPGPNTDEEFKQELVRTIAWYFYNPAKYAPSFLKTFNVTPSIWAEKH